MQEIVGRKGEEGILIDREDIPSYFDNSRIKMRDVWSAVRIYSNFKNGFWPYTGGYMEQLYDVYRVTQILDGEWYG